jgi:hypothetical protein
MPRHLKKTAVRPTSGMPHTRQLAASGGVLVSEDAIIARHRTRFAALCYVEIESMGAAMVRQWVLADELLPIHPYHKSDEKRSRAPRLDRPFV